MRCCNMSRLKESAYISRECVACGCCVKVCPTHAVRVRKGLCAEVDESKCVGCGKCAKACPAGVIEIKTREVVV